MKTVRFADGTTIAFDRFGEGPPVILVGACAVPKLCSHPVIIRICRRNRVLTPHTDDAEN
jgi:hypothetical protein